MLQEAADFREESEALYAVLAPLADAAFATATGFKRWSFDDLLGHLHFWNHAALLSLEDEAALDALLARATKAHAAKRMRDLERDWREGIGGGKLREAWRALAARLAVRFSETDPRARVKWAGPGMSVRSSVTARLMETWAHGQAIYDALGLARVNTDRIRGIAVLGVNTFEWTFRNRGLEPPAVRPYVDLVAPSGARWTWNDASQTDRIEGPAEEYCQVVTQTRNVADTALRVEGEAATRWMAIAQCFAGPPEDPPAPGSRGATSH